jgi:Complex 1 protein (LYR family)
MQLGSFRPVNREALHLYRDILRGCKRFHWCNEKGEPWSELLRQSARKEFEQAREERVSNKLHIYRTRMQHFIENACKTLSDFRAVCLPQDPLIHAKLLVVGRQCLNDTLYKFDQTNAKIAEKIANTRTR